MISIDNLFYNFFCCKTHEKKTYKDLYAYNMNIYIAYKYNAKITHYLFTQTNNLFALLRIITHHCVK